jgi:hypothetical protein
MVALVTAATLAGAPAPPAAVSESSRIGPLQTAGIVLAATTAVIGGGALIWSGVLTTEIDARRAGKEPWACAHPDGQCDDLRSRVERRDVLDQIGVMGLGVSGGVAAVTLGLILLAPDGPKRDAAPRVVPIVGQQAGLLVHGAW